MTSSHCPDKRVISAFTDNEASSLTGISLYQLRSWHNEGFFEAEFAEKNSSLPFSRMYSFDNLVALRALNKLRNDAGVTLQHLREVKRKLKPMNNDDWGRKSIYVVNKKVVIEDSGTLTEALSDQSVIEISLRVIHDDLRAKVKKMRQRRSSEVGQIEHKRTVARNKERLSGTRVTVDTILEFVNEGYSVETILSEYPFLKRADINAVINQRTKA